MLDDLKSLLFCISQDYMYYVYNGTFNFKKHIIYLGHKLAARLIGMCTF